MFQEIYEKHREIVCYLIVGVMTTIVSLGVYYICVVTFCDPSSAFQLQMANVISWIAAVLFAYFSNRRFVFQSRNEKLFKEMISFCSSRVITLVMDMGCMFLMVSILKINDKIAKIIVQVIVTVGNYIISKFFIFK